VAEWFKAAVLKTARGFTLPRGFESHPFRQRLGARLRGIIVLFCFALNPGHPDRVQQGKAKLDGYPVPPDPRLS
jgi:hypothetical protein